MTPSNIGPFSVIETHGRAVRPENELVAHSEDVGWRSLHAAIFREAPIHITEPALGHPFIIYHLTHPTEVTRKIEGARREKGLLGPRNICITPPETMTQWEHHGHPEILQIYLRRSLYEAAVGEMYGCDAARHGYPGWHQSAVLRTGLQGSHRTVAASVRARASHRALDS